MPGDPDPVAGIDRYENAVVAIVKDAAWAETIVGGLVRAAGGRDRARRGARARADR
ncbi:hypothetical protein [Pseudonocardia endophytica]|uniref:Uncharacterized protein n=1 Tax=Pseudonocardia endophytica TaxID=401976 RepID=A0A4R1HIH9_PSEEN|nr:hypothetical protein [Pseudonocardia endophytica]TCK21608.1 hypothetical protein EV378_5597 [Pseudonocardia endophytica]